jgi:hypothetical protein
MNRNRVATWFIFIPKIQIFMHCGMPLNGNCMAFVVHTSLSFGVPTSMSFGIFCHLLVYFVFLGIVWYVLVYLF